MRKEFSRDKYNGDNRDHKQRTTIYRTESQVYKFDICKEKKNTSIVGSEQGCCVELGHEDGEGRRS